MQWAVAHCTPKKSYMTYEEFLDWDYEGGLTEWVDGEVVIYPSATAEHQQIIQFLMQLLGLFNDLSRLGQLWSAPYAMRAVPGGNGREPDLFFVTTEHLDRVTPRQLEGPADLVIEVISDESVTRDRDQKFKEYAAAGIPEYWIIDPRPNKKRADFYTLDVASHQYELFATEDDERVESRVVTGFWLNPNWLWTEEADPLKLLVQMVGMERLMKFLES